MIKIDKIITFLIFLFALTMIIVGIMNMMFPGPTAEDICLSACKQMRDPSTYAAQFKDGKCICLIHLDKTWSK